MSDLKLQNVAHAPQMPARFDYHALSDDVAIETRDAAVRVKTRMSRTAQDIIEIGKDLAAVKEKIGHGNWLPWLDAEFGMGDSTARRLMRVANKFGGKSVSLTDFTKEALYELAAPSTPDEVVDAAVAKIAAGGTVTVDDVRKLKAEIKAAKERAKRYREDRDGARMQYEESVCEVSGLYEKIEVLNADMKAQAEDVTQNQAAVEAQILMGLWNQTSKPGRDWFLERINA
jgi:hypothetical protein